MNTDRIVIPTVELSWDPETAIEIGTSWGARHFELRTLWENRRVPFITDEQKEHLKGVLDNYGADVVALSPGLFIGTEARDELASKEVAAKLPASIELAKDLGAEVLIIFSFKKTAGVGEDWVIDQLGKVVEAVEGTGLVLAIEPITNNYGDCGEALGRIVRGVNSDILGVNWDAANVARAGYEAYPDEYEFVKGMVKYVHLKNHTSSNKHWAVFDHEEGDVDLKAQLADLLAEGYDGYLSIETHTRYLPVPVKIVEDSKHNYDVLTRWLSEGR